MTTVHIDRMEIEIDEKTNIASFFLYGNGRKFTLKAGGHPEISYEAIPLHVYELTEIRTIEDDTKCLYCGNAYSKHLDKAPESKIIARMPCGLLKSGFAVDPEQ